MIKGQIPVTWTANDYVDLQWRQNPMPLDKFKVYQDPTVFANINNYMASEGLPPVFAQVAQSLGLRDPVVCVNKMTPGQILPLHSDYYGTYARLNGVVEGDRILRIVVFLHEPRLGHQLWIEDQLCQGPAGSYWGWYDQTPHMAANLGLEDRYILQITSKGYL